MPPWAGAESGAATAKPWTWLDSLMTGAVILFGVAWLAFVVAMGLGVA